MPGFIKRILYFSVILLVTGCFQFNMDLKQQKFWEWFSKNQEKLYNTELQNHDLQNQYFNELSDELGKIHPDLVFEFTPIQENKIKEFTISADGIEELFPIVISLIDKAPNIDKWKISAFRQRIAGDGLAIKFGELSIGYDDMYFRYIEENGKLGIELNIRHYTEEPMMQNAIYILLDSLIGEYDVVTKIDWIDWVKLNENDIENLAPIKDLKVLIDRRKQNEKDDK